MVINGKLIKPSVIPDIKNENIQKFLRAQIVFVK
jgi:hypothetical protein